MMTKFDLKNPNKLLSRHSKNLRNYYEQKEMIMNNMNSESGSPKAQRYDNSFDHEDKYLEHRKLS